MGSCGLSQAGTEGMPEDTAERHRGGLSFALGKPGSGKPAEMVLDWGQAYACHQSQLPTASSDQHRTTGCGWVPRAPDS